jgi:hypothetical protein
VSIITACAALEASGEAVVSVAVVIALLRFRASGAAAAGKGGSTETMDVVTASSRVDSGAGTEGGASNTGSFFS